MSELARIIEALLFLSAEPGRARGARSRSPARAARRSRRALAELARGVCARAARAAPARARRRLTLASDPIAEDAARALLAKPRLATLTPAQLETLAIVAYLQPVSRPEIARIRGVNADSPVASLLDRGLIEESGRSQFGAVALPHDDAVPQAVRAPERRRAARRRAVGSHARGGARRCATACSRRARPAPASAPPE